MMDLGILGALLMLVAWAVLTVFLGAPAWSNALLTLGVFLLILRVVMRGTASARGAGSRAAARGARSGSPAGRR